MKYEKAFAEVVSFDSTELFLLASQGRIDKCTAYKRFTNYNDQQFDCFIVSQVGTVKEGELYGVPWIHCDDVDPITGARTTCKVY